MTTRQTCPVAQSVLRNVTSCRGWSWPISLGPGPRTRFGCHREKISRSDRGFGGCAGTPIRVIAQAPEHNGPVAPCDGGRPSASVKATMAREVRRITFENAAHCQRATAKTIFCNSGWTQSRSVSRCTLARGQPEVIELMELPWRRLGAINATATPPPPPPPPPRIISFTFSRSAWRVGRFVPFLNRIKAAQSLGGTRGDEFANRAYGCPRQEVAAIRSNTQSGRHQY